MRKKLEDPAKVRDDWCREYVKMRDKNKILRAALKEIAGDPTGVSSYQAGIAKQALAGKYAPFGR